MNHRTTHLRPEATIQDAYELALAQRRAVYAKSTRQSDRRYRIAVTGRELLARPMVRATLSVIAYTVVSVGVLAGCYGLTIAMCAIFSTL